VNLANARGYRPEEPDGIAVVVRGVITMMPFSPLLDATQVVA